MSARADRAAAAYVELSRKERALVDRMKAAVGATTDPNLIRIALWSLADHLDLEMPDGAFDLREGSGKWRRTKKNPKIRQHVDPKPKGRVQAKDHPWQDANRLLFTKASP